MYIIQSLVILVTDVTFSHGEGLLRWSVSKSLRECYAVIIEFRTQELTEILQLCVARIGRPIGSTPNKSIEKWTD